MSARRVGVIGLGYVGSAVAAGFAPIAAVRHHDPARPDSTSLADLAAWADVLFVCVPTPTGVGGAADLSAVESVFAALAPLQPPPVVLKSTVPPGTSERLACAFPSIALCFSPEFLRERASVEDFARPSRIVLGWTAGLPGAARAAVLELHVARFPGVPMVEQSATEAELLKVSANAFFAVKVSWANEMAELAAALGVPWEPVRGALVLDPRIADDHLRVPGPDGLPGFGGSCLPKDADALLAVAEAQGQDLPVLAAAVLANRRRR